MPLHASRSVRRGLALLAGAALASCLSGAASPVRERAPARSDAPRLRALASALASRAAAGRTSLYRALRARTDGPQGLLNADPSLELMGVDVRGRPFFLQTHNLNAARTVQTERLWPGGSSGLALTGANTPGQLGIWDGGGVLLTHQEFGGRVAQMDSPSATAAHATHVAGTLIAAGVSAQAHGMSPAASLQAWDWTNDASEMATAAAAGMLVSNHSYGYVAGWYRDSGNAYFWYGDVNVDQNEDPGFGYYGDDAQAWDQVAAAAPNYLIVMSAGNDRDDTGPPAGGTYSYWDPATNNWASSTVARPADGGATGYDSLPYRAVAKNALTVGAVADIVGGWTGAGDVAAAAFSSWGPTDDGRIKPDLVANGVGLTSAVNTSNTAYAAYSGTSMASPSTAGSLHLLARHWQATHAGATARSATLKAIAIHTVDEAGPAEGPDYMFGWGLLNARAAAELVSADVSDSGRVREQVLADGARDTLLLRGDGTVPIVGTLCWTDPAGTPPAWSLDPPTRMLVNDLDLRLEPVAGGAPTLPYVLDPANPAAAATRGDNDRDNVEKVRLASPAAGDYRVIVSHKGSLAAPQAYTLVLSGLTTPLPARPPTVDNVAFAQRRDGSGLVDVTYDLADADSPTLIVTLEASADDGVTWDLVVTTVSGDIGPAVTPGSGKAMVWDFAADNPGRFDTTFRVRVTAQDAP